jgi:hypothetical protein
MTAPYQSKLIPHEEFIRQCRAKRWSYPRIANTGASTIFDFVKVRARKKRLIELPPSSSPTTQPIPTSADGFFEPAPDPSTHEIRKPKYKINF